VASLKTVEYAFPTLAALSDAVVTNLTQITVALPESGKTFRSVRVKVTCDDIITATGGTITEYRIGLRLGAAAYTTVTNLNDITNSGENLSLFLSADFTSHFTTNWSGTSMTCDLQVYVDQSTGTTLGMVNVSATLEITYEYDETSATQVKTVYLPLAMTNGALATSKPGVALATIQALDTYLPESSKTYRDCFIVIQGNEHRNAATTDHTLSMEIDTLGVNTSGNYEGALASDRWFRYVWSRFSGGAVAFTTNATHSFYAWASVARVNHAQAYMAVTYEYDATASTDVFVSLWLAMEFASPMGGTSSSDYQRATREMWIQEPGTIAVKDSALFLFWDQAAAIAGLNVRVGTGAFTALTDTASVLCGGNGAMLRCESVLSLARGRNELQADVYRTDTADLGWNMCAWWLINYTAGKPTQGYHAANKTVRWCLKDFGTGAASTLSTISATAPVIPETDYFLTAVGVEYLYLSNTSGNPAGVVVHAERLAAEGGVKWENVYTDVGHTDPEVGLRRCVAQARSLFKRWPGDPGQDRIDIETARRWRVALGNACTSFDHLDLVFSYHSISYPTTRAITGSSGGTVDIGIHRHATGELVLETSRVGDGNFSFTWYDNTEELFTAADEATANLAGRSEPFTV